MRLLNTTTIELAEFVGARSDMPKYAILSHTWGEEEVTYQDMSQNKQATTSKKGYVKILGACTTARNYRCAETEGGLDWIWVDTCCIDKSSSAELSEAINSMYAWYSHAQICFAYLSDTHGRGDEAEFRASRWFTRGWTLQELIAPRTLEFYSSGWDLIGNKRDLKERLSDITGIGVSALSGYGHIYDNSVAQRMSWAAKRATTREEDMAYCLMGLFGVHMPLLYGEGDTQAFIRLQEEIMKYSKDQSIFAWGWGHSSRHVDPWKDHSYLAQSPQDFSHCGNIVPSQVIDAEIHLVAGSKGIKLEAPIYEEKGPVGLCYIPLQCRPEDQLLTLMAMPVFGDHASSQYRRTAAEVLLIPREAWDPRYVAPRYLQRTYEFIPRQQTYYLGTVVALRALPAGFEIVDIWPPEADLHHWHQINGTAAYSKQVLWQRWTKAAWEFGIPRPIKSSGYARLRWSGREVASEANQNNPNKPWPDVLLCLHYQPVGRWFHVKATLAAFSEVGPLTEIVPKAEKSPELRAFLNSESDALEIGRETIRTTLQLTDDGSRGGSPVYRLYTVDVTTPSCQPWSLDNWLRKTCALEIVRGEITSE